MGSLFFPISTHYYSAFLFISSLNMRSTTRRCYLSVHVVVANSVFNIIKICHRTGLRGIVAMLFRSDVPENWQEVFNHWDDTMWRDELHDRCQLVVLYRWGWGPSARGENDFVPFIIWIVRHEVIVPTKLQNIPEGILCTRPGRHLCR